MFTRQPPSLARRPRRLSVPCTALEIQVTGVGVGETDVMVKTDHGELRLPVVVK